MGILNKVYVKAVGPALPQGDSDFSPQTIDGGKMGEVFPRLWKAHRLIICDRAARENSYVTQYLRTCTRSDGGREVPKLGHLHSGQ